MIYTRSCADPDMLNFSIMKNLFTILPEICPSLSAVSLVGHPETAENSDPGNDFGSLYPEQVC